MSDQADSRGPLDDPLVGEILDAVDDPALVCDATGAVRAWNESLEALTAHAAGDLRESTVGDVISCDADPLATAVETGDRETARGVVEGRSVRATVRPVERDGAVTGVVLTLTPDGGDVADSEDREPALAQSRERLATILDDLPVAMMGVDADGTIAHCRGLDFETVDCDRADVVGAPVERFESVSRRLVDGCRTAIGGDRTRQTTAVGGRSFETLFEPLYDDGEVAGAMAVAVDVTDRLEREQELETREQELRAVIESSADPIVMQDADGRYRVVNEAFLATTDRDREEVIASTARDVFDEAVATRLEAHRRDVLETERARVVEEAIPGAERERTVQLTLAPYCGPDGAVRGTVSIARDITELERQRDELERLTAIQGLVQENVRAIAAATTREEITRTVCERLAGSQFYEFAWIGERAPSGREIRSRCSAGSDDGYLDDITVTVDPSATGLGPAGEAYRSGEIRVVHDVAADPAFEPWRERALERGFRSIAGVPLTHGTTTHGVLTVYADRPGAFSKLELAGFETLGDVVGFALSAAQHRRLLETDSVLELEFDVRSDESPFDRASAEHGCRFVFENAVQTGDERVVSYLTVEGADPAVAADVAGELDNLERIRRLDRDGGPHFELTLADSVFQFVADAGARGERWTVEDGVGRLVVEAPGDADVRCVTAAIERRFSGVDLVAKREKRRGDSAWWQAHGDIGGRLTDRQRGVLRAAYYSGYYEWPRETDSETLADSLDVASTTFLQHLRKGHGRVLEAVFDS